MRLNDHLDDRNHIDDGDHRYDCDHRDDCNDQDFARQALGAATSAMTVIFSRRFILFQSLYVFFQLISQVEFKQKVVPIVTTNSWRPPNGARQDRSKEDERLSIPSKTHQNMFMVTTGFLPCAEPRLLWLSCSLWQYAPTVHRCTPCARCRTTGEVS